MSQHPSPMIIGNIAKLPAHYAKFIIPLFLSCFMSGIVSLVNMFKNVGWVDNFFSMWLSAWGLSWLIAFPVIFIVLPFVKKLTAVFVNID